MWERKQSLSDISVNSSLQNFPKNTPDIIVIIIIIFVIIIVFKKLQNVAIIII